MKKVADIMEGAHSIKVGSKEKIEESVDEIIQYASMTPKQLDKAIAKLENQMYEHATNLNFEEATAIRDQIQRIRQENLDMLT